MAGARKKSRRFFRKKIKARKVKIQKAPLKPEAMKIKSPRCIKCKAPLSGIGYKLIARPLFGIKPSKKKRGCCNKCE